MAVGMPDMKVNSLPNGNKLVKKICSLPTYQLYCSHGYIPDYDLIILGFYISYFKVFLSDIFYVVVKVQLFIESSCIIVCC